MYKIFDKENEKKRREQMMYKMKQSNVVFFLYV